VNEMTAKTFWPGQDPVGQCVVFGEPKNPCFTVIGVTVDAHLTDVIEEPVQRLFVPLAQAPGSNMQMPEVLIVRAHPRYLTQVAEEMRRTLRQMFPGAEPPIVAPMTTYLAEQFRPWRLGAKLFVVSGLLALIVTLIGIYSVVSYAVAQRMHEMGVRVAVGAQWWHIIRLVLGDGARKVGAGILLGIVLSIALSRLVESMLYGTSSRDPVIFAGVAIVLLIAGAGASLWPAWRAMHVDPAMSLRAE
jgi:hypothetical protein